MELNTVVMAPKAQISKQLFNVLLPYIVVIILIIVYYASFKGCHSAL